MLGFAPPPKKTTLRIPEKYTCSRDFFFENIVLSENSEYWNRHPVETISINGDLYRKKDTLREGVAVFGSESPPKEEVTGRDTGLRWREEAWGGAAGRTDAIIPRDPSHTVH